MGKNGWHFTKDEEKKFLKRFREASRNFRYFYDHLDELRLKYADKWVAVFDREIVDYDDDIGVLRARLGERYEESDIDSMIINYVPKEKPRYLLLQKIAWVEALSDLQTDLQTYRLKLSSNKLNFQT